MESVVDRCRFPEGRHGPDITRRPITPFPSNPIYMNQNAMKNVCRRTFLLLSGLAYLLAASTVQAADLPPEVEAASEKVRKSIPLGGDFQPKPERPAFVAVGHGARVLLSTDDGQTWTESFYGFPGSDHSAWAVRSVAIDGGLIVVPIGWYGPSSCIASEDGTNWRHLTDGKTPLGDKKDLSVMPPLWGGELGGGTFVGAGYMQIASTPDLGKTWFQSSLRSLGKNDPAGRKLSTHHVTPVYCGDATGRFIAIGNDRSKENPNFGNLFATDDQGKTWTWLQPTLLNEKCEGYSGLESNGDVLVLLDKAGANAFVSSDAGDSWEGPFPTGADGGRRATLSLVDDEFWVTGRGLTAHSSADGKTWQKRPDAVPASKLAGSPEGTLIAIQDQSILRSTDGGETWNEVYSYEIPASSPIQKAQGLRELTFGTISQ